MALKSRVFNVMQYERHPETGEVLLTEEKIKDALAHRTIKRYAYIAHDEDVYSALDEEQDTDHVKGQKKPKHWHIVIEMGSNAVEITTIAKWLGIKDNYVNVAKGRGAFLDCCQYLTHEDEKQQGLGKRLYEDSRVVANFDFRGEIDKRQAQKIKYGRDVDLKTQVRYDVLYNGMTLKQAQEVDRFNYMDDMMALKKYRLEYIATMDPPITRINYYVCGSGGIGKGLICRALARSLFPQYDDDYDIFFEVGAKGAPFEGYDGQPVIIWNDRRAYDLLKELGDRGNVFNVFDTHPTKQRQNIKYSSINLCNVVNIVNSVQPYEEFLSGLVGEYKDKDGHTVKSEMAEKSQSGRRFPFILPLRESDIEILVNKGFVENTRDFEEYLSYGHIRANMALIAEKCNGNKEAQRAIEQKVLKPITGKHEEVVNSIEHEAKSTEELMTEFEGYGAFEENAEFPK